MIVPGIIMQNMEKKTVKVFGAKKTRKCPALRNGIYGKSPAVKGLKGSSNESFPAISISSMA